eukprot:ANDGO_02036.mRNA.1 hypothetical protein
MPKQGVEIDGYKFATQGGWRGFSGVPVGRHTVVIEEGSEWILCECEVFAEPRRSVWVFDSSRKKLVQADDQTAAFFQDIDMSHVLTVFPSRSPPPSVAPAMRPVPLPDTAPAMNGDANCDPHLHSAPGSHDHLHHPHHAGHHHHASSKGDLPLFRTLLSRFHLDVGPPDASAAPKTTFDSKKELDLLDAVFDIVVAALAESPHTPNHANRVANSCNLYHQALMRNYLHDSVMAEHPDYFIDVAKRILYHIAQSSELVCASDAIRTQIGYLADDLCDIGGPQSPAKDIGRRLQGVLSSLCP